MTEAYKEKTGKNVHVFLANMGKIPQHKARADFSTSFLQVGAFEVHLNNGFQDDPDKPGSRWEKCVAALQAGTEDGQPYDCAVICSKDDTYPEDVPALAPMIKQASPAPPRKSWRRSTKKPAWTISSASRLTAMKS